MKRWFSRPRWSSWLAGLLAVLLAAAVTRVYWGATFPYTHDGSNHLARFANYAAALREGQFPPRFAPYLNSGFGFPVFNYNYPLANLLAVPLIAFDLNPEKVFALIAFVGMSVGVASAYLGLRRYFSRSASIFGTLLYAFSAYNVTNIVFRGGIGELMAYSLTPLAFLALDSWQRTHKRSAWFGSVVVLAALLLTHNVLALMSLALLGLWSLSWAIGSRKWLTWFLIWLAPVGLTLWFWLPALAEIKLVALSSNTLIQEAAGHTLTWSQLLFSPWRFGFSRVGPLDTFGFGLGPAWLAVGFLTLVLAARWLVNRPKITFKRPEQRVGLLLSSMALLSLFLTLDVSKTVWQAAPLLAMFQFPWRWLFLFSLVGIPIGAWVYERVPGKVRLILLLALWLQISAALALKPADRFHYDRDYYRSFPGTTTTRNENRPLTFTLDTLPPQEPRPSVATGAAEIKVDFWLGTRRRYSVQVAADALLVEPTVYFPGWEVRDESDRLYPNVFTDETKGLVAYELLSRAEPYRIDSGFTGRTWPRLIGEAVSLVTLLTLMVVAVRFRND